MKKNLSLLLALTLLCSLSVTAFADTSGDQNITLTVPEETSPSWTLNIPADMTVAYRAESTALTMPTITNVSNLEDVEIIDVTIRYTGNFSSGSDTIPFTLVGSDGQTIVQNLIIGGYVNGVGYTDYTNGVTLDITGDAWNAAAPGTYSTVITYSSRVTWNIIVNP